MPCWFTRTNSTAHAHQYCIFQSHAKTVPSRMKLTMKLTTCMREPASMTTNTWSRRVMSDFNSVLQWVYTREKRLRWVCSLAFQSGEKKRGWLLCSSCRHADCCISCEIECLSQNARFIRWVARKWLEGQVEIYDFTHEGRSVLLLCVEL